MLHQLGNEKLYYADPLFVSRSSHTGKIVALAFNYPAEYEEKVPSSRDFSSYMNASPRKLDLTFTNLKAGTVFEIETLDKEHGNVYDDYCIMGMPHSPSREEIGALKLKAWGTTKEIVRVNSNGTLTIKRALTPWSCMLIREL